MSDVAIRVEGLGKQYRIVHRAGAARYRTLREELLGLPRQAWAALRGNGQRHETFWALRDVSFEVKQGEVLGVIGRNGAGKSTLLKILARITEPTTGQAEVYGRVGSLLEVGTGFHPELTGRENIFLSGAVLGMTRREVQRKFDEIVAFAEVEQFLDTPAKHYSSGMYMRLAFAVAAHLEPEILLVDEVLAVGDAEFQKKCLGKMGEVARAGRTVLFVSHNLRAVNRLCQRAILVQTGSLAQSGAAPSVIADYLADAQNRLLNKPLCREKSWRQPPNLEVYLVELLDEHGHPTSTIRVEDDFSIRISCQVHVTGFYRFGISLLSEDGMRLAASMSDESGSQPLHGVEGECYEAVVLLKNVLLPGKYSLEVQVKSKDKLRIDTVEDLEFAVAPAHAEGEIWVGAGHVHMACRWLPPIPVRAR